MTVDVALYEVIAARKRLEAAMLEGRVHVHFVRRHSISQGGMQWVLVTRGRKGLCGTRRCVDFDHLVHIGAVGKKMGAGAKE